MKTEAKITNRMIKLKESLGPRKLYMLYAFCSLSGLFILLFAYWPLMSKLSNASIELGELQAKLSDQQRAIAALDNSNIKSRPIQQNELSLAITELTGKGHSLGLQFSSIAQKPLQETTQTGIAKLPINFTIESEYETIGQFLTYIEDSSHSMMEVESLFIHSSQENPPKISIDIVLNLYVEI